MSAGRLLGADDELTAIEEEIVFPAGVVALGRGGAGEVGALRCPDGRLAGLLCFDAGGSTGRDGSEAPAAVLPHGACQFLTLRRPVDLERRAASWDTAIREAGGRPEHAALATHFADEYLPLLGAAGWSDIQTLMALFGDDADTLRHDLHRAARTLPGSARAATLSEAKALAGDWFAPLAAGKVVIGWSLTALTAQTPPDWLRVLLEEPALAGLPIIATLHLGPASRETRDPQPPAPMVRDDGEWPPIERAPRAARLFIACTVEPQLARQARADVERHLAGFGFRVRSLGPARGYDTLLSCAPLGRPVVGSGLLLPAERVAGLVPYTTTHPVALRLQRGAGHTPPGQTAVGDLPITDAVALPLGLCRDGEAVLPVAGEHLLLIGAPKTGKSSAAHTWALARVAAGGTVLVVDSAGAWAATAIVSGGQRADVGARLGAILGTLGFDAVPGDSSIGYGPAVGYGPAMEAWVTDTATLLGDLRPSLSDDDHGDLTAALLDLAGDHLAGRDLVHLHRLIGRLGENGSGRAAEALTALVAPAGSERHAHSGGATTPAATATAMLVFDAAGNGDSAGPVAPTGLAAAAMRAAIEELRAPAAGPLHGRLVIVDDLTTVLAAAAGPRLLLELLYQARRVRATVWCVATAPAQSTVPDEMHSALQALDATGVVFSYGPDELQAAKRWLILPDGVDGSLRPLGDGEIMILRGGEHDTMRIFRSPLLEGLTRRERAVWRQRAGGQRSELGRCGALALGA